jgi:hypothetical protein
MQQSHRVLSRRQLLTGIALAVVVTPLVLDASPLGLIAGIPAAAAVTSPDYTAIIGML